LEYREGATHKRTVVQSHIHLDGFGRCSRGLGGGDNQNGSDQNRTKKKKASQSQLKSNSCEKGVYLARNGTDFSTIEGSRVTAEANRPRTHSKNHSEGTAGDQKI